MTYQKLMMQSLSDLLENEEDLKFPIYGTLQQKNRHWFGFWGLTDNYLLSVLLVSRKQIYLALLNIFKSRAAPVVKFDRCSP